MSPIPCDDRLPSLIPPRSQERGAAVFDFSKNDPRAKPDVLALLEGAREGSRQNIGELLQYYRNYLLLLATTQIEKRLQPRISPSDIVQETMLRAHRHFAQFRGESERELQAWLRQILVTGLARFVEHNLLAAKRDMRREISIDGFGAELDQSSLQLRSILRAEGDTPSVEVQNGEDAVILANRLARLSPRYREVLVLRHLQGLSFEQVATRMSRSLGATRMLWLRAIEKLREVYRKAEQYET